MTPKLLFSVLLTLLFTCSLFAQTDSTARWSKPFREGYIDGCIGPLKAKIGEDSARILCTCVTGKMEAVYSETEINKLTKEDLAKPEMKVIMQACMNIKWSAAERANFMTNCEKSAAPALGEEKAKQYCSCMQQKIETKFPLASEADKLTKEDLQKPEWQTILKGCLQ